MTNEFLLEVFFIKIKIKGYLKNITENHQELIETFGIKNQNKITYILDGIKYKIDIKKGSIILTRENDDFFHSMHFENGKINETSYYIKSLKDYLQIDIKTTKLNINDNNIEIQYETLNNSNKYLYKIEMSDKNEHKN